LERPLIDLPSGTRLQIAVAVSQRPRTLGELSQMTGITVQGVLKHLKALEAQGLVSQKAVRGRSMKVRKVYLEGKVELGDYSTGDLLVVKTSRPAKRLPRGAREDLEALAEEIVFQRRRVREQARRLRRAIEELSSEERALRGAIDSLKAEDDEKMILRVLFSEESQAEGGDALLRHFGLRDGRRSIDKAMAKARQSVRR
jgi:predicted transcriptional regulator